MHTSIKEISQRLGLLAAGICMVAAASAQQTSVTPTAGVTEVLQAQVAAWNAGNIDEFMRGYHRTDTLRFASGGNIRRGYDGVLARYKTSYSDRAAMGKLTFEDLEVTELSDTAAVAFGHWNVTTETAESCGLFSLTWRLIDGQWRIIHDHTSSAENC